jgi:5-methylcytosine-specific restriction protein A
MPYRPAHPCSQPGCRELVHERFCPKHAAEDAKHYEQYHRNKELKALYDRPEWRRLRRRYITEHPLCEDCNAAGRYVPAQEVHHVTPVRAGGGLLDWANLRALCKRCHSQHTAREGGRWGAPRG